MSEMLPRITGTEMEWAIEVQRIKDTFFAQASVDDMEYAIKLRHAELARAEKGQMLSNGGRYYVDVGAHLEYATPETRSFQATVTAEIAGERIVYDAMQEMKKHDPFVHDAIVNKRVVDDELHTWGYHMSFCCDANRLEIGYKPLAPLGMHLATHNIYGGAGAIIRTGNRAQYVLAQKVLNLNQDFSLSSHGSNDAPQPLISLRHEDLADSLKYTRIHITSMDANMSPWATWMKLGTTSVVLRMMELGYLKDDIRFEEDMHRVANDVAYDTSLSRPIVLENGRTILAIEVQEALLLRAQKMASKEGLPDEEMKILDEWERALIDLRRDPELLSDRSDWIAKRKVLNLYMARHAINSLDDERVIKKDRQWSHIGALGIGERLRQTRWAQWMPSEQEIDTAYLYPPQDTRAATRSRLIRDHLVNGEDIATSWQVIHVPTKQHTIHMDDPYSLEFTIEPRQQHTAPIDYDEEDWVTE